MALTHFWKLDDNAASTTVVATVGTNATLLGGDNTSAKHSATGPGTQITSSFDLNGTDDAIDITGLFSRTSGQAWSVSAWWNRDATGNFGIVGTSGSANGRITSAGDTIIRVTSSDGTGIVDFTVSFSSGTWYHVLVTHSAGNSLRCFVNGVESVSGAQTFAKTLTVNTIAKQNAVFLNGRIAWVKLFDSDESANVADLYAERDTSATSEIAITSPVPYFTYQRDGSDQADVTITGSYSSATATSIEYRLDGGSWATLDNSLSGGTFSGVVSDVATGVHTFDVRLNDETDITDSVANVLVGDVILVIGQSNAAGRLTNDQSYTHASLKAAMYDGSWAELADSFAASGSTGSPWPLLATQWLDSEGVPLAIMNKAVSGTAIATWWDSTAQTNWTTAKSTVTASGVNGLAAVLIDLGENDAANDTLEADFNTDLDGLAADVQSTYGCPLIVCCTGTQPSIDADSDLDAIRSAQITAWGDNANVAPGPMSYDRAGLHWESDAEGATIAARWWLAIEAALFGGANDRGPRFSSATVHEYRDQLTVVFDRALKTGLTFSTAPWTVLDDGTPVTLAAVTYHSTNANAVVLTLSAPLSGDAGTCTVTFASGNDAAGVVVPKSTDITMPVGSAVQLPAEPFYAQAAEEAASGTVIRHFGGRFARYV